MKTSLNNQTGFTLIELLVVISIIGLMSSTVIAAVNSARVKADNVARVRMVQEYKKAFDLSYDADGYYPGFGNPATLTPGNYYCLGDYTTDTCQFGPLPPLATENSIINNALERFLSSRPKMQPMNMTSIVFGDYRFDGPIYTCGTYIFPSCTSLRIMWIMVGNNADCGFGITTTPTAIGYKFIGTIATTCYLYLR